MTYVLSVDYVYAFTIVHTPSRGGIRVKSALSLDSTLHYYATHVFVAVLF